MRTDKSNVPNSIRVVEFDDQPILVTGDVEYNTIAAKHARISVPRLDLMRCRPICQSGFLVPSFERLLRIPVKPPEVPQGADSNDSHTSNLTCSHFGNKQTICTNVAELENVNSVATPLGRLTPWQPNPSGVSESRTVAAPEIPGRLPDVQWTRQRSRRTCTRSGRDARSGTRSLPPSPASP